MYPRIYAWDDRLQRLLSPDWSARLPPALRYVLAAPIAIAATVLRVAVVPWIGTTAPYNAALLASVAATVLLGFGPGLLATVLADVAVEAFVLGSLSPTPEPTVPGRLVVSLAISAFICYLLHALHTARDRAERQSQAVLTETAERRTADEMLRTTVQRFHAVLSSMNTGLLLVTSDGQVEFVNQSFCDFFSLTDSPADLVSLTAPEMLAKIRGAYLYPDEALARIGEIVDQGQPVTGEAVPMRGGYELLRDFIPIQIDGQPFGRLWYHTDITDRRRAEEELKAAYDRDSRIAQVLQDAIVPPTPYIGGDYRTASVYIPAFAGEKVGGDFYDVFAFCDGHVGILIGDVAGKGVDAAARAASTRSAVRALAHALASPAEVLADVNRMIGAEHPEGSFVTAFLAALDLETGHVRYSIAGHPEPALLRLDGSVDFLQAYDYPLGVLPEHRYGEAEMYLDPGDAMVLYTDGIYEARGGAKVFGTDGIQSVLLQHAGQSARQVCAGLLAAVKEWTRDVLRDDTAIIVIQRRP